MDTQRFVLRKTPAAALLIIDSKDDSIVCVMNKTQRPYDSTYKMAETMTAALNAAVQKKGGA